MIGLGPEELSMDEAVTTPPEPDQALAGREGWVENVFAPEGTRLRPGAGTSLRQARQVRGDE